MKRLRRADGETRQARIGHDLVAYRLRRSARRTIGFTIDAQGLSITAPHRVALPDIDRAIADKQHWIARKLVEWRERVERHRQRAVRWADGGTLLVLNETLTLSVRAPAGRARIERDAHRLQVWLAGEPTEEALRRAVQRWLQARAREVFGQRLAAFAQAHGVAPARWSLSSARTRWGSCSAAGAIRLNWRLVHFPLAIVDYVIAHELAHLAEMNHGPRFWQRVTELYPDWQAARGWLRANAHEITTA